MDPNQEAQAAAAVQQQQAAALAAAQAEAARQAAETATGEPQVAQAAGTAEFPQAPHVDHAPQTPDEIAALAHEFAQYRAEIAALRDELRAQRVAPRVVQAIPETEEQRKARRLAEIAAHSFYCPACGILGDYAQKCSGPQAAGHAPLEMVSTEELSGDPANHTAAPSSAPDGMAVAA